MTKDGAQIISPRGSLAEISGERSAALLASLSEKEEERLSFSHSHFELPRSVGLFPSSLALSSFSTLPTATARFVGVRSFFYFCWRGATKSRVIEEQGAIFHQWKANVGWSSGGWSVEVAGREFRKYRAKWNVVANVVTKISLSPCVCVCVCVCVFLVASCVVVWWPVVQRDDGFFCESYRPLKHHLWGKQGSKEPNSDKEPLSFLGILNASKMYPSAGINAAAVAAAAAARHPVSTSFPFINI